ncbi:serine/threonine-protein kinase pkn1 [Abditibacteriota bacterium]|nr:serine/threonine-protein kinase pkn1 [Abditibacteriota bacterium]
MRYSVPIVLALAVWSLAGANGARAQDTPAPPTPPEGMILVPSGNFIMGTDETDNTDDNQGTNTPLTFNDARPRRTVNTKAFFLDKTEVTNAQYKKFCDATNYPPPPQWIDGKYPEGQDNFPVVRVSWYEARAFATWSGKRLPTEAEWEHAARGTDGRTYPWGEDWGGQYVVWESGPVAVGSKPLGVSPYGALDMAGNASEWVNDWFDGYPNSPTRQPDFGNKKLKVVRGGAWYGSNVLAQSFHREVCRPEQRSLWIGFRCAKDAE